jgi:chemotaxis protein CheX
MTTRVLPTMKDLLVIVEQIWSSYLDPEGLHPFLAVETAPGGARAAEMHACVSISGTWNGHVVVECSPNQARSLAAAFLAIDLAEVGTEDMVDVLGEFANIVGGNIKSMLPPECFLSPPHVMDSCESTSHGDDTTLVCELVGVWLNEPLSINMWHDRSELVKLPS